MFEEALKDLGQALRAFSRKDSGFPRFRKRGVSEQSFRLRQSGRRLRVGTDTEPRALVLPRALGVIRVREDTRSLRRLLGRDATIQSVTINERRGRYQARVLVKAPPLPKRLRQPENGRTLGFDRGFFDLVVVADADGKQVARARNPRFAQAGAVKLVRLAQALSRKKKDSKRYLKAREQLNEHYAHVAAQRRHALHHLANELVETQAQLVGEDLCLEGMTQRYGKSLQEAALGELMRLLDYKLEWRERELTRASRWYPSTRRCADCGQIGPRLDPSGRSFHCQACGLCLDRDLNAARNLAQWPDLPVTTREAYVAGKRTETPNAREEGASTGSVRLREPTVSGLPGDNGTPAKGAVLLGR